MSAPAPAPAPTEDDNTSPQPQPPPWLANAKAALQAAYPNDKFDVILRGSHGAPPAGVWRVKCLECPGKLYTPGPGETLANYEVHLGNRQHRQRVDGRVNGGGAGLE